MYSSEMGKVIADDIHAVELDFGCIDCPRRQSQLTVAPLFKDAL